MSREEILLFSLLVFNYYVMIWLLVRYKTDGQDILFIILITYISIERVFNIVRGTFAHGTQTQQLDVGLIKSVVLNVFFVDYSINFDTENEGTQQNKDALILQVSILVHSLNAIPILCNIWLLLNEQASDHISEYLAITIYGFAQMTLIDFILYLKGEQTKSSIFVKLYRLISNGSKKVCFYLIVAVLINYNLAFIFIYAVYLLRYLYSLFQNGKQSLSIELIPILQIQYVFSSQLLARYNPTSIRFLKANIFSYSVLILIFCIYTGLNLGQVVSMIIIDTTFVVCALEILSQIICLILFVMKGPAQLMWDVSIDSTKSVELMQRIVKQLKFKTLTNNMIITLNISDENIFLIPDFMNLIKHITQQSNSEYLELNMIKEDNNSKLFSLITLLSKEIVFFINTNIKYENLLYTQIFKYIQQAKLDCTDKHIYFNTRANSQKEINIQRVILNEIVHYYPNSFYINKVNQNKFLTSWYSSILNLIVYYKQLNEYIPINSVYLLYDLYD